MNWPCHLISRSLAAGHGGCFQVFTTPDGLTRFLGRVRPSSRAAVPELVSRSAALEPPGPQTLRPQPGSSGCGRLPLRPRFGSCRARAGRTSRPLVVVLRSLTRMPPRPSLPRVCCLPAAVPASEVSLGFPLSLPGVSVGSHGSLLLLGVLGSNSICGRNQRHCAGEVAVFLKALSPLAQETDPKGRTLPGEACSIPGFQSLELCSKKQSISNLRRCGD